jgi:hypothetical protein
MTFKIHLYLTINCVMWRVVLNRITNTTSRKRPMINKEKKEEGKKRKKRGKRERIQNFLDVGLSFMLLSTSPSMRPCIATNTFLRPLFLGNVVHPPSFPDLQKTTPQTDRTAKDDAPNGLHRKRRHPQRIILQKTMPQTDRTAKTTPLQTPPPEKRHFCASHGTC